MQPKAGFSNNLKKAEMSRSTRTAALQQRQLHTIYPFPVAATVQQSRQFQIVTVHSALYSVVFSRSNSRHLGL